MIFELAPGIHASADPYDRRSWGGMGWLGGSLPSPPEDGRAKILNVPARVQITVLTTVTYEVVARTVSKEDGTWRVNFLDPGQKFTVIGWDAEMQVNSAIQDWVQPAPMDP